MGLKCNTLNCDGCRLLAGSRRWVDIASLHSHGRLERFIVSGVHLGVLGGCQETGIKLRKLGPIRDVIGVTRELVLNK